MLKIVSATKFADRETGKVQRISAILEVPEAVVSSCSLVKTPEGEVITFPPTVPYTKKNGDAGFDRIVVFKDINAANAQAAALYNEGNQAVKLFETPSQTKLGERIGFVTLTADITLKVLVYPATDDKPAMLKLPKRLVTRDGKEEEFNYVWPFKTKGDELKAEIAALTDAIIAEAKDYVPAE